MVQKSKPPSAQTPADATPAPKRRGRPRAYEPDVALGKALSLFRQGGLCGDLARRSECRDRHEPAEPLRRVRRQARALHQELPALSRRCARGHDRHIQWRIADQEAAGADLRGGARHLSLRRGRAARLLHGDDGGLRSGGRSRDPRHGAGRPVRTRQGVRRRLPPRQGQGRACRRTPIPRCWRSLRPPPSTPSRSAPVPGCRARSWRRSSRARSM